MGLISLIKRLSNSTKTSLLGKETTRIIRYSFVDHDHESLPQEILDSAVALHAGIKLVNSSKYREQMVECLPLDSLYSMGFTGEESKVFDDAVNLYSKNLTKFLEDFEIEKEYEKIKPKDDRTAIEIPRPIYGQCNGTKAFPHPYQLRLKKELIEIILKPFNYNTNKTLVTMPTGAGKTVLAMETIVDLVRNHSSKKPLSICWLVSKNELAEQSLESFRSLWMQKGDREVIIQRYYDRFNTFNECKIDTITFSTFELLSPRLIRGEKDDTEFVKKLDYLFIDEAHFTGADEYSKIFEFYQNNNKNPRIIGLTATPTRTKSTSYNDFRLMFNHFLRLTDSQGRSVESPIKYLQDRSYLSTISFNVLNDSIQDLEEKKKDMSGYYKSLHHSVLNTCKEIINRKENTIIFAESKAHAIALCLFLRSNGVENELIVGDTPPPNRKLFLNKLGDPNQSLSIIVNERILSTGIDVPGLNSIIVLSDIDSVTSSLQILGRAMRGPKNGGNKNNKVYLTKNNRERLENYDLLEIKALN